MTGHPAPTPVLDQKQLARIESVHRGFMYQHLYAAACLLTAKAPTTVVRVERDEDIEFVSESATHYIQVKTRSIPLAFGDIEGALERFDCLRIEHASGKRSGRAHFVVLANTGPSEALLRRFSKEPLESDVSIIWPEGLIGQKNDGLPQAWPDLSTAIAWCTDAAEKLPLRLIGSESLVWKVAAHVAVAASGTAPYEDHCFHVACLSTLFEQLVIQLQKFPEPLQNYRPLQDEPPLESEAHLRIISGFSGEGKTSWAAQAAAHSPNSCVYYDASDTPPSALAGNLVREIAAQLRFPHLPLNRILAPGATGLQSLRALDDALSPAIQPPILVIDNAHSLTAEALNQVSKATRHIRSILLGHPVPMIAELEALAGVTREELKGWSLEDVAAEAETAGCRGSIATIERLRTLTGGSPLYVQGAARLAASQYGGDLSAFCSSLEQGTHQTTTAQEAILARIFEALSPTERAVVAFLSLADVPLDRGEASQLLIDCMGFDESDAAAVFRKLRLHGLVQFSIGGQVLLHDAVRILGKLHLTPLGAESSKRGLEALRAILLRSILERRDVARLGAFARVLASLNDLEPLIDLIGEELFHELGAIPEVIDAMERGLASSALSPDQQFWAHDGIVFAAMKHGGGEGARAVAERSLQAMEALIAEGHIPARQQASLWMKKMLYEAEARNVYGMLKALQRAKEVMPDDREHMRVYEYNTACAFLKIGRPDLAEGMAHELVKEYYSVLGISPEQVLGVKQDKLATSLREAGADIQEIKHLADTLELLAMAQKSQGNLKSLARIHAMRFYQLTGAVDSVVRTGLDVADDFVLRNDFLGARQVMEEHVLPCVREYRLVSRMLDARSLYAIILAYSGLFAEAELEMQRIAPLVVDAPVEMQRQIAMQRKLIAELRVKGVPPQRKLPALAEGNPFAAVFKRQFEKRGRNEPCPCGSGRKFKKCHGAN